LLGDLGLAFSLQKTVGSSLFFSVNEIWQVYASGQHYRVIGLKSQVWGVGVVLGMAERIIELE